MSLPAFMENFENYRSEYFIIMRFIYFILFLENFNVNIDQVALTQSLLVV